MGLLFHGDMNMAVFSAEAKGFEKNVLEHLQRTGVFVSAPCGGRGACGKCLIRFLSPPPPPTPVETEKVEEALLAAGWRLACQTKPSGAFSIEYSRAEEDICAETHFFGTVPTRIDEPYTAKTADKKVAIDIGTTTIAASLVDAASGVVLDTKTRINHQRSFGADVISRIQASNEGAGEALRQAVTEDIAHLVRQLGEDAKRTPIIISGNTTMEHLLQGLDCRGLGVAPYTPVDISLHTMDNYLIMPGISTYVGADIVSGICACGMDQSDGVCMLIDLGTNGEMAIGNRNRLVVASTAAGPAFEGGNISCGVAGIPGAISGVMIQGGKAQCHTIMDQTPIGLCGTGVLETVYELLQAEIMDETGCLIDAFENGFPLHGDIVFTQADIRKVQLAKAAIRAGVETLIEAFHICHDEIEHVYLAGGFGQKIDLKKAAGIGLLPPALIGKTQAVGNSSLAGAVLLAMEPSFSARLISAADRAQELSLAGNPKFTECFVDQMTFDSE